MHSRRRRLPFQTVGWEEQEEDRPRIRWPDVGRVAEYKETGIALKADNSGKGLRSEWKERSATP
jgi:hypothetical protein